MITRTKFALALALLALLALPATGLGATAVGQTLPPGAMTAADCAGNSGHVTRTMGVTNPYIATASGVITEWQFQAETNPGSLALQVLTADPNNTFMFIPASESATEAAAASQLNRFKTRLPISVGQYIALHAVTPSHGCFYLVTAGTGFTDLGATPAPVPGSGSSMYGFGTGDAATNVAATIEPDADGDGFGDETQDGCPGNGARTDDCVKPTVKIDKGPRKRTKKRRATFAFSSNDAAASFECSLDDKKFTTCSSPLKTKRLKRRRHTFEVRAVDANRNASDPALYKWKVKKKKKR